MLTDCNQIQVDPQLPVWNRIYTRSQTQFVTDNLFDTLFQRQHSIRVVSLLDTDRLETQCCLFTADSKYIIVGSVRRNNNGSFSMFQNNESMIHGPRSKSYDYTFYLVDIVNGCVVDSKAFPQDNISIVNNHGIYLYENTLAILSVQHQTVHLFYLLNGEMLEQQSIGRFCYPDDALVVAHVPPYRYMDATEEACIPALKHRLLVYLFRRAHQLADQDEDLSWIVQVYQYYEYLKRLRILFMQLLDHDHILLQYGISYKTSYRLFVVYHISEAEIISTFDNTQDMFGSLFYNYTDNFLNNIHSEEARYMSTPSNNTCVRALYQHRAPTFTHNNVPVRAQACRVTPYLDQALFAYDDSRVALLRRESKYQKGPIRFYGRDSNLFKFQLHMGRPGAERADVKKIDFIWHPNAPFVITLHRSDVHTCVHFHLRVDTQSFLDM